MPPVEQRAEHRRGKREADVKTRINRAVDAPGGAGRCGAFDEHVARWRRQAGAKARQRREGARCQARQPPGARQQQQQRRARHGPADGAFDPFGARHQEAADRHAGGAAQHVGGDDEGGQRQRQAVDLLQRRARKTLDRGECRGRPEKEAKTQPHRRLFQEGERVLGRQARGAGQGLMHPGARAIVERRTVAQHHHQHQRRERGRREVGDAPRTRQRGEPGQEHRRQRPAEIAGDAMHRIRVPQARLRHALVEDGEVHRMKSRIAQAGQHRGERQPGVAVGAGRGECGHDETAECCQQHRPGADLVDQEAGERLADGGDDEERAHQQTQLGVRQAEVADEGRKQRRQQQMKEMRGAVRKADQADGARVIAQRHGGDRRSGGGCMR